MQEERKEFSVGKIAKVFDVSVSGYYAYLCRKPSLRAEKNKRLVDLIRKIDQEGRAMYGSPRIHVKLQKMGNSCSKKAVALYKFSTRDDAKKSIFECVDFFYNRKRAHFFLGYLSPEDYERNWSRQAV